MMMMMTCQEIKSSDIKTSTGSLQSISILQLQAALSGLCIGLKVKILARTTMVGHVSSGLVNITVL